MIQQMDASQFHESVKRSRKDDNASLGLNEPVQVMIDTSSKAEESHIVGCSDQIMLEFDDEEIAKQLYGIENEIGTDRNGVTKSTYKQTDTLSYADASDGKQVHRGMSENEDVGVAPLNQAARDEQKETHEAKNEDLVDPTVTEYQQYQIVASWNGGQSQDIIIKRKQKEFDAEYADSLYEGSDFKQRKEVQFARKKLKDQRPSSQFEITEAGKYVNDPEEALYEIY